MKRERPWNRCDCCGRFIGMEDFRRGAVRYMSRPDTAFTAETYVTLCARHGREWSRLMIGMLTPTVEALR